MSKADVVGIARSNLGRFKWPGDLNGPEEQEQSGVQQTGHANRDQEGAADYAEGHMIRILHHSPEKCFARMVVTLLAVKANVFYRESLRDV